MNFILGFLAMVLILLVIIVFAGYGIYVLTDALGIDFKDTRIAKWLTKYLKEKV